MAEITKNCPTELYNISMVIYVDMVFLINFAINTVVLWLTGVLCRRKPRLWRLLLGGAASALFYLLILLTPARVALNIFTSFVVLAPGIWLALRPRKWRDLGVLLGVAYICAFALGGLALVVMNVLPMRAWSTAGFAAEYAAPVHLIIAIIISFCIIKFVRRQIANKMLDKQAFKQIGIYLGGKRAEMRALVDTGMSLTEPISQKPVIIAEFSALSPILPESIVKLFQNKQQHDLESIAKSFREADLQTRIRMLPFKSIGKQNGVLTGFRPDKIEILGETPITTGDVIIGICDFDLGDGEYSALMNPIICD
ncbi:MAG: sigma-E processing peptidase SpoIIGA [Clostridiales bacterium]|nr:sigma-E processing peptidase SpoIIGA [Clostridiales bacterium]